MFIPAQTTVISYYTICDITLNHIKKMSDIPKLSRVFNWAVVDSIQALAGLRYRVTYSDELVIKLEAKVKSGNL
jgi:hypothetical protein